MKKQNIEDANLLRDYAQKISMHPNCAPTETIAEWYAILFNKFPSVQQLHYRPENINTDVDPHKYLVNNLPDGFSLLSVQHSDIYEKLKEIDFHSVDMVYLDENRDGQGVIASKHTSISFTFVDYESRIIVISLTYLILAAYDVADKSACAKVRAIFKGFSENCLHKQKHQKHISYLVNSAADDFELLTTTIKNTESLNIGDYYNDDFAPIAANIERFVNGDESGLVILHGEHGTGKTSFIRHLINSCERQFVYMPMNMATQLTGPSLVKYIQKHLSNSVVIIEDCEQLLADRSNTPFNVGVANILNVTDGILGDSLKIRLICTFNSDIRRIDKALLRKGRLVDMYEFKRLTTTKTDKLMHDLYGENAPATTKPMTLAEIFNYGKDNHCSLERKPIGFA